MCHASADRLTIALRVTSLNHEILDDTMENDIVVVSSLGQCGEVLARSRGMFVIELDRDGALES